MGRMSQFTPNKFVRGCLFGFALIALSACQSDGEQSQLDCVAEAGAVKIDAGIYSVGSDKAYPEEGPMQEIELAEFWLDRHEVTVEQFAEFVAATRYTSVAERPVDPASLPDLPMTDEQRAQFLSPGGAVFTPDQTTTPRELKWWVYVPGASWRNPRGPDARKALPIEPVTQIALEDALAYARWAGGRLPSEAEWEVAAALGSNAPGDSPIAPENANTWQGVFPVANEASDGFEGVAPIGCFEPSAIGLYDMLGNVWEWTSDPYQARRGLGDDGAGIADGELPTEGVIKGGSYLCAPNYCMRYRPSARQAQETGLGTNHIGFRLAYDSEPNKPR